jgi:hypothetical protein
MAISDELFRAVLVMDAYNCGYAVRVETLAQLSAAAHEFAA